MRALLAVVALVSSSAWAQAAVTALATTNNPSVRRSTGFAADPLGDGLYAFGGFLGGGGVDATLWYFQLNGRAWLSLTPTSTMNPPGREQHGLAITSSGQLVLFGGFNASGLGLNDTWLLDTTTLAWTGPFNPAMRPSVRGGAALHYVPASGTFVLFGGVSSAILGTRNNQVWSLDTRDGGVTWSQVTTSGTAPSARNAACTALDDVNGRLVVFGGEAGAGGSNVNDTFSLDLATNTWRNDTPTGTAPSARSYCASAWDPVSQRMLLYGGQGSSNPIGGAFTYDPVARAWTDVTPSVNVGARADASGAHHPSLPGMLFFAGRTALTTYTSQTAWFFVDAGAPDAGSGDAGANDAGANDAGANDAGFGGFGDAGFGDAGFGDAGFGDAGFGDAGFGDAGFGDAGLSDAGLSDAGLGDAGRSDAGLGDAGLSDAGFSDAGFSDAGFSDAGATDASGLDDGGTTGQRQYAVGCGCSATEPFTLLGLAALVLLRRRRRRQR